MALTELTALQDAYQALQPLGRDAQRRALQWLTDALTAGPVLPDMQAQPATTAPETSVSAAVPVAVAAPARRRKAAVVTGKPTPTPAPATATVSPKAQRGRRLKGGTTQTNGQRPYRRMPDPVTIMKAYRKVGNLSGLADRFEVPRHTVNHWARQLRNLGYEIGRTS